MKIDLEVEAITPVFIAGADQRNIENEGLRAPTIRGLMRWWFRAIMGGMTSIKTLQELEDRIFGSTKNKSLIRVISVPETKQSNIIQPKDLSIKYLWFSIAMQAKQDLRTVCYAPKSRFRVSLESHDESPNEFKVAAGGLWILLYLGGIGSRMRRGAGSLKVLKADTNDSQYEFEFKGKTINEAKNFITNNLLKILKDHKQLAGQKYQVQQNPKFFVFSKQHAEVALLGSYVTYDKGLQEIGSTYQQFRRTIRIKERGVLGLPIIDKFRRVPEFKDKRHSSPLLIGVMDLNGKYAIRLVKSYTSIHQDYALNLAQLKHQLNRFDSQLESKEVKVEIPEVDSL